MRMPRVSAFTPEVTQQIHSFFASGVMSSQTAFALDTFAIAFLKSAGSVCAICVNYSKYSTFLLEAKGIFDIYANMEYIVFGKRHGRNASPRP